MMPLKGRKIGCLGGGAMGEAIVAGLLREGLVDAANVIVSDVDRSRLDYLNKKLGISTSVDNTAVVTAADVVIMAVKPHVMVSLLKEVAPAARREQTFISIAAGITIEQLQYYFDQSVPVIRAIPNTPCLVGEGATALSAGKHANESNIEIARAVFAAVGKVVEVPEAFLDAVTGLSGSGPAYMYIIIEALTDGAVRLGLPRETARMLAAQTMLGAAKMVLDTGEHPSKLKDMVTTPGGTTMAGLFALEDGGVRALMMQAVAAATRRSRELSGNK